MPDSEHNADTGRGKNMVRESELVAAHPGGPRYLEALLRTRERGLARARKALAAGDLAVAAYLLGVSIEDVRQNNGGDGRAE